MFARTTAVPEPVPVPELGSTRVRLLEWA